GAGDAQRACCRAAAPLHPGCEPCLDLGRQVPDRVAIGQVDPDAGLVVEGWVRNQEEFVAFVDALEVAGTLAEDEAVDGGAEAAWVLRRERRWLSRTHVGPRIAGQKTAGRWRIEGGGVPSFRAVGLGAHCQFRAVARRCQVAGGGPE